MMLILMIWGMGKSLLFENELLLANIIILHEHMKLMFAENLDACVSLKILALLVR